MVSETYNYGQFKFGVWNRDIKEKTLAKIDKDVRKNGWKKHPILVNSRMEVIDGQHRLTYAKSHNLPVYYVVVGELTVDDCVTMNNVRTAWTVEDYIKLYASQGNENYIRLKKLLNDYSFTSINGMCALIRDESPSGNTSIKLKNGTFKISDKELERIKARFDFLEELAPYINGVKGRQVALFQAVSFCYQCPDVNNSRLKKQIKEKLNSITPPANLEMAFREIERIYNYKITTGNYRYIYTEYQKYAKAKVAHEGGKYFEKQ